MRKLVLILVYLMMVSSINSEKHHDNSILLFKDKFFDNLRTDDDLKNLQRSIILQRNYKCLNGEYFELFDLIGHKKNFKIRVNENLEFQLEKTVNFKNNFSLFYLLLCLLSVTILRASKIF